jgi:hypothetical protein
MKPFWLVLALLASPAAAQVAQDAPRWVAAQDSGCRAWDNYPYPDDRLQWDGPCVGGYVEGSGTLHWVSNGAVYETVNGEFKGGKLDGHGVVDAVEGHFDGEFRDNRPNGQGVLRASDGAVYSGVWVDGCFQDDAGRRATFYSTAAECAVN